MSGFEKLGTGVEVCKNTDALAEQVTLDMFKPNGAVTNKLNMCRVDWAKFRMNEASASWRNLRCVQSRIPANFKTGFKTCIQTCGFKAENDPFEYKNFQLEDMIDALEEVKMVKKDDGNISGKAVRYLELAPTKDQLGKDVEGATFIRFKHDQVKNDIELVDSALKIFPHPAVREQLMMIRNALTALPGIDPSRAAHMAAADARANSATNQALGYAGKLGAVVLLGGAALLSGIMSIINKKFSIAPFLYAGTLMYILNPDFLTGKDKHQITESAALLNNDKFVYGLAPKYCIKGKEWGDTLESLFALQAKGSPLIQAYLTSPSSEEALKNLLDELAPGGDDNAHRARVRKLLCKTEDFKALVAMTGQIKSKDVVALATGYVREGAWTYARKPSQRSYDMTRAAQERQAVNTVGFDGLGGGV